MQGFSSSCTSQLHKKFLIAAGLGKDEGSNHTEKKDWRFLKGCWRRRQSKENGILQEREREKPGELDQEQAFVQLRYRTIETPLALTTSPERQGLRSRFWWQTTNEPSSLNKATHHPSNCWEGTSLQGRKRCTLTVRSNNHLCCCVEPGMVRILKTLGFCKKDGRNGNRDLANGCFTCDLYSAKWYIALNAFDEMSQSRTSRL